MTTVEELTAGLDREARAALATRIRGRAARLRLLRECPTPADLAVRLDSTIVRTPAFELVSQRWADTIRARDGRLTISVPPQQFKTLLSRWAIFWALLDDPDRRVVFASYGMALARTSGRIIRALVETYGAPYGLAVDRSHADAADWQLDGQAGGVLCAGVGSSLTGRPSDLMVLDDLLAGQAEADSDTVRGNVHEWWETVARTRMAPGAPAVAIGTRWHECLTEDQRVCTIDGMSLVSELQRGDTVLTSEGPQRVVATKQTTFTGRIVEIQTYARPFPVKTTPEHPLRTEAHDWLPASDVTKGDWLLVPSDPNPDLTTAELAALLSPPPPPRRKQVNNTRLTGERIPVSREDMERHLADGLTYDQIAALYGRKTRTVAWSWAVFYGLNKPGGHTLDSACLLDPDFWRVVGLWLAEGSFTQGRAGTSKNVVRWTFSWKEENTLAEFVVKTLSKYGLTANKRRAKNSPNGNFPTDREWSVTAVSASSSQLAALLREFGSGAHGKFVASWAQRLPRDSALALVGGWTDGDGCSFHGGFRVGSVSYALLDGMQRLLARHGVTSAVMRNGVKGGELRWGQTAKPYSTKADDLGRGLWVRVKTVTTSDYDGPVYDLQTPAGDFVAENLLVHNCDVLSRFIEAGWDRINIPAQADGETVDTLDREPGEYLVSTRGTTAADWDRIRRDVGERAWAALYQGRPAPLEGGIFQRAWVEQHRVASLPDGVVATAVAVDPADTGTGDEAGILVGARGDDGHLYVHGDRSGQLSQGEWAYRTCLAAVVAAADTIVQENNLGMGRALRDAWALIVRQATALAAAQPNGHGDRDRVDGALAALLAAGDTAAADRAQLEELVVLVEDVLSRPSSGPCRIIAVTPRQSKFVRASAISGLYETGRAHHVGTLAALEYQMFTWQPGQKSPDRLDTLAHLLTHLDKASMPASVSRAPSSGRVPTTSVGGSRQRSHQLPMVSVARGGARR